MVVVLDLKANYTLAYVSIVVLLYLSNIVFFSFYITMIVLLI